jgi:hypothetical protein
VNDPRGMVQKLARLVLRRNLGGQVSDPAAGEPIQAHIVEKHDIAASIEHFFKLVQIIDFNFDFDEMTGSRAHRLRDLPRDGNMIVLDKDGVVEAEAVIGPAARAHRLFLDKLKAVPME